MHGVAPILLYVNSLKIHRSPLQTPQVEGASKFNNHDGQKNEGRPTMARFPSYTFVPVVVIALCLVRVRRIRLHDPDFVIMKRHKAIWQLHFRHMAADAVLACHGTSLRVARSRRFLRHARGIILRRVTRQTFRIVGFFILHKILVRIVAGNAAHPWIGPVEALAVGKPVWLKAHVYRSPPVTSHNRFPCAMALAAEVRDIFRSELSQIGWCSPISFALNRSQHVGISSGVAVLAGYTGLERLQMQRSLCHAASRMATETVAWLTLSEFPSHRFIKVLRSQILITRRNF